MFGRSIAIFACVTLAIGLNPSMGQTTETFDDAAVLDFFGGISGSKQPQDFGVNANLGFRTSVNYARPLTSDSTWATQVGAAVTTSDNAVRVFELLGEDTERWQSFGTAGLFRDIGPWRYGAVFDVAYQDGFDESVLGQCRTRIGYMLDEDTQIAFESRNRVFGDEVRFNDAIQRLRSIDQYSIGLRRWFQTGVTGEMRLGVADRHGESNAVTGSASPQDNTFVFGADFLAPLNGSFAIYGETNLMMPADTGTVDAYLGLAWFPKTPACCVSRRRFRPLLPVAAATSFAIDLLPGSR